MPPIFCENEVINSSRVREKCGCFLGVLTDEQLIALHSTASRTILRCRRCPPEQRWIAIYSDEGALTFEALPEKPTLKRGGVCKFDQLKITQQIA